jgi:hypothetical protein
MLPLSRTPLLGARLAGALAITVIVAGCVTAAAQSSPTAAASPAPTQAPSQPSGPSSATGFYLRAWRTQALAPQYTFSWLSVATISDGKYIDGMVAVPMIYPGPLWVGPSAQTITAKGIDAIVADARALGLLGSKADFNDNPMAGGVLGHITLVVDGKTYELTGSPDVAAADGATPAPGTNAAFAAFWNEITVLALKMPAELGPSAQYEPERLAVLALPPTTETSGITPNEVPWPLVTPFASFGTAMGNDTFRCAVVSGADLVKLLPVIKQSNALTRFVDSTKVKDSLLVRVMVPGEPSPCA